MIQEGIVYSHLKHLKCILANPWKSCVGCLGSSDRFATPLGKLYFQLKIQSAYDKNLPEDRSWLTSIEYIIEPVLAYIEVGETVLFLNLSLYDFH